MLFNLINNTFTLVQQIEFVVIISPCVSRSKKDHCNPFLSYRSAVTMCLKRPYSRLFYNKTSALYDLNYVGVA